MRIMGFAKPRLDISEYGGVAGKIGLLRQITQVDPRLLETRPTIRLDESRRDLQKRRFAGAIAPDKTQTFPCRDLDSGRFEERHPAESQRNILQQ